MTKFCAKSQKPIFAHFGPFFHFLEKSEFSRKIWLHHFCALMNPGLHAKNQKNRMSQFWANKKNWFCPTALPTFSPFCPFWGQTDNFLKKWQHRLKRLMVFYHYAKKYKKRLNGSKDMAVWKIKQSDWPRAFRL